MKTNMAGLMLWHLLNPRKRLSGYFTVDGKGLTHNQVLAVLEYAIEHNCRTEQDIPTDIVEKIVKGEIVPKKDVFNLMSIDKKRKEVNMSESTKTCRSCEHRKRYELNGHSKKVVQCCELQRSNHSNSGYKTIKVTDQACCFYRKKGGND